MVRKDDLKKEKSETKNGSWVKGSRIRKPVPPPVDEVLVVRLWGVLMKM